MYVWPVWRYTDQRKPRRKKGTKINEEDDDDEKMNADAVIQDMEDHCITASTRPVLSLALDRYRRISNSLHLASCNGAFPPGRQRHGEGDEAKAEESEGRKEGS